MHRPWRFPASFARDRSTGSEQFTTDSDEAPKLPIIAWWNAVLPESAYKVNALYLGEPGQHGGLLLHARRHGLHHQ